MTSKRRGRTAPTNDHLEPVALGHDDLADDDQVLLIRTAEGHALIVPRSVGRLSGEAQEVVSEMQSTVARIVDAQSRLRELVTEARSLGASWDAIGWSVGTTGRAASYRFGEAGDDRG